MILIAQFRGFAAICLVTHPRDSAMANQKNPLQNQMKVGDRVEILNSGYPIGRIVELRGPLGPNGTLIYRVRIGGKKTRKPTFIELREDQLQVLPVVADHRCPRRRQDRYSEAEGQRPLWSHGCRDYSARWTQPDAGNFASWTCMALRQICAPRQRTCSTRSRSPSSEAGIMGRQRADCAVGLAITTTNKDNSEFVAYLPSICNQ